MIDLVITYAGLDALVDARNGDTEAVKVTTIGLTERAFDPAPTLNALPGEFKRIDSVAGEVVAANIIHMTAQDKSADTYDLRGIALYLDDGTLFATFGQADPIFSKVSMSLFLLAFNVRFSGEVAEGIDFGDASFLNPPATEDTRGVAEIATSEETAAGKDDSRIVSPLKLAQRLSPIEQAFLKTITGAGLVTGGGSLAADRVLTVLAASAADVRAGTAADKAITPAALGPMIKQMGSNGYCTVPTGDPANTLLLQWGWFSAPANAATQVSFPIAFSESAWAVMVSGTSDTTTNDDENFPTAYRNSYSATGFQAFNQNDTTDACAFFAIGRINLA